MKLFDHFNPFGVAIFVYIFAICQPIWAETKQVDIHWKISPNISDNGKITTDLRGQYNHAVSLATECINKALVSNSKSNLAVNFKLKSLTLIEKAFENRQIKQTYLAFEDKDHNLINGLGNFNTEIHIFSSSKTESNYVPVVYSDQLMHLYNKIPSADKIDGFLSKDPAEHNLSPEISVFMQEYIRLWNSYVVGENYFNNVIYLYPVEIYAPNVGFDFKLSQTAGVLAHELLHAWGGLNDTYNLENGDAENDNSIMANTMNENLADSTPPLEKLNCVLSEKQVNNIKSYLESKSSSGKVQFSPRIQIE